MEIIVERIEEMSKSKEQFVVWEKMRRNARRNKGKTED